MLGAIIGDILGSKYEFDNIRTKDFSLFEIDMFFTDDTVMTVAIADALMKGIEDPRKVYHETVQSMHRLGRKFIRASYGHRFRAWLENPHPQPYGSYGNGAGMRVSSCGWLATSLEQAKLLANIVTSTTHDHPEGIKGGESIAAAVYLARTGSSKAQIKRYIETHYYDLNLNYETLKKTYSFNETAQGTNPQAIYAFLISNDFEDALRTAISIGGDSDTVAAMTGAIAEAFYGIPKGWTEKALHYLPNTLVQVVEKFYTKFIK
jgi:type I restriction enzyme M protein